LGIDRRQRLNDDPVASTRIESTTIETTNSTSVNAGRRAENIGVLRMELLDGR
jgi:hypothetical protein